MEVVKLRLGEETGRRRVEVKKSLQENIRGLFVRNWSKFEIWVTGLRKSGRQWR